MEYVMIAGFISLVILPTTFLFYSYASDTAAEIDRSQVDKFGRDVIASAETVYYLGHPSRIVLEERLPNDVVSISIDQDPVTGTYLFAVALRNKGLISNFTFPTSVRILGNFGQRAITSGQKRVRVYAGPNINNKPFVTINLEDSACEGETLAHNTCSATQPLFCFNGVLINHCDKCECASGTCQADGTCQ